MTASVGVSIYPDNAINADELLQYANVAMYEAKERGKNQCVFFECSIGVDCKE